MNSHNSSRRNQHQPRRLSDFSRRRFLKGLGACVALPAFESLLKTQSIAAAAAPAASGAAGLAATATGAPRRLAFVYFPHSASQPNPWPTGGGGEIAPLEPT